MRALLVACIFLFLGSSVSAEPPRTLKDCYELALKRSEQIAIQQELIKETEAHFLQALSGALPRASFSLSEKRQDGTTGGSSFTLKEVPERKFVFSQPLFSGFKEFAAMSGSRAQRRQRAHEKVRAEGLLLIDVSDAFYLLLQQREDLAALETIRTALVKRIDELNERERLGRSRPSEVASAEAQLRRVEAEVERVQSLETTGRQLLEFLTGLERVEAVVEPDVGVPPLTAEADDVGKADARPDVQAAQEQWNAAKQQTRVEAGRLWPTVGLEGDYYTTRVGASAGVDWDVLLKVDVPIFQGGQARGAVREASAKAREAEFAFERAQRAAALDIRQSHARTQSAIDRVIALEKALAAAEDNYRLQMEDYRRSLVNNLEVLQALQALEDTRREAIQARYEAKRQYWSLRVATGAGL